MSEQRHPKVLLPLPFSCLSFFLLSFFLSFSFSLSFFSLFLSYVFTLPFFLSFHPTLPHPTSPSYGNCPLVCDLKPERYPHPPSCIRSNRRARTRQRPAHGRVRCKRGDAWFGGDTGCALTIAIAIAIARTAGSRDSGVAGRAPGPAAARATGEVEEDGRDRRRAATRLRDGRQRQAGWDQAGRAELARGRDGWTARLGGDRHRSLAGGRKAKGGGSNTGVAIGVGRLCEHRGTKIWSVMSERTLLFQTSTYRQATPATR